MFPLLMYLCSRLPLVLLFDCIQFDSQYINEQLHNLLEIEDSDHLEETTNNIDDTTQPESKEELLKHHSLDSIDSVKYQDKYGHHHILNLKTQPRHYHLDEIHLK